MRKIKAFILTFLTLLIMGLIVGPIGEYSLSDIHEGIIVLSPFALLSSFVIIKDMDE